MPCFEPTHVRASQGGFGGVGRRGRPPMPYLVEVSDQLGPKTWCMRVHATGRAEVARLASQTVPHGVERRTDERHRALIA